MAKFEGYHTALQEPTFDGPPVSAWEGNGNKALAWDLMDGLPPDVLDCAAIYGEPPWKQGYQIFNDRAGIDTRVTWESWLERYSALMETSGLPACAMVGKQGLQHVVASDVRPITLTVHSYAAFLVMWNGIEVDGGTTDEVSIDLARRYGRVADLCCGFGRSSRLIAGHGGKFVAVDANPLCIGYIAKHGAEW